MIRELKVIHKKLEEHHQQLINGKTFTIKEMQEQEQLADKLKPYQCQHCFQYIIQGKEGKDYQIVRGKRWHTSCRNKWNKELKKIKKRQKEQTARMKQIQYEHEHSLRPRMWTSYLWIYGLKKNYVKFEKDLPKILKKYNLTNNLK